jgi:PilZ domain
MNDPRQRRQQARHPLRWKAAIAFDPSLARAIVHTQTLDISASGAALYSDYDDLTGATVMMLLALPASRGKDSPSVLKIRARIVSTVRTPEMSQYRHGLSFVRFAGDGVDALVAELKNVAPAAPQQGLGVPAAVEASLTTTRRLDLLKEMAQQKLTEAKSAAPAVSTNELISEALKRTHAYLQELAAQLNVIKPGFPKSYAIAGVPDFSGLVWESGRADFYTREISSLSRIYDRVSMSFVLSGNKQIRIDREYPASDRLKRILADSKIEFNARDSRNARGMTEKVTFEFPCKVSASVQFMGRFDTGRILLRASNVSGFGAVEQILAPESITTEALDEFSGFILGETKALSPLLLRNA